MRSLVGLLYVLIEGNLLLPRGLFIRPERRHREQDCKLQDCKLQDCKLDVPHSPTLGRTTAFPFSSTTARKFRPLAELCTRMVSPFWPEDAAIPSKERVACPSTTLTCTISPRTTSLGCSSVAAVIL